MDGADEVNMEKYIFLTEKKAGYMILYMILAIKLAILYILTLNDRYLSK